MQYRHFTVHLQFVRYLIMQEITILYCSGYNFNLVRARRARNVCAKVVDIVDIITSAFVQTFVAIFTFFKFQILEVLKI